MTQKYIPTKWVANETIGTANVMNNIEQGILNAHNKVDSIKNSFEDCSLGVNGYCRLPNGLLLQWGRFSGNLNEDGYCWNEVPFNVPFNSVFNVNTGVQDMSGVDTFDILIATGTYDRNKFWLNARGTDKDAERNPYLRNTYFECSWFAIGL